MLLSRETNIDTFRLFLPTPNALVLNFFSRSIEISFKSRKTDQYFISSLIFLCQHRPRNVCSVNPGKLLEVLAQFFKLQERSIRQTVLTQYDFLDYAFLTRIPSPVQKCLILLFGWQKKWTTTQREFSPLRRDERMEKTARIGPTGLKSRQRKNSACICNEASNPFPPPPPPPLNFSFLGRGFAAGGIDLCAYGGKGLPPPPPPPISSLSSVAGGGRSEEEAGYQGGRWWGIR